MEEECVFCKIGKGKLPSHKVYEDNNYIAFMDIYPPSFGGKITMPVVIVITKKHLGSDVIEDLDEKEYQDLLLVSRKIAKAVKRGLKPLRVCMVFEGMEVDHIHTKLYPIFRKHYPGYLSTEKSPRNKDVRADDKVLSEFAKKIVAGFKI